MNEVPLPIVAQRNQLHSHPEVADGGLDEARRSSTKLDEVELRWQTFVFATANPVAAIPECGASSQRKRCSASTHTQVACCDP